jgi:hypothetical protein
MQMVSHPCLSFVRWTVTSAIPFQAPRPFSQEGPTADSSIGNKSAKNEMLFQRVKRDIPQQQAAELYYSACGMIDWHNRCPQEDLRSSRESWGRLTG